MAEDIRDADAFLSRGAEAGVSACGTADDHVVVYAPGERERIEKENEALLEDLDDDPDFQNLRDEFYAGVVAMEANAWQMAGHDSYAEYARACEEEAGFLLRAEEELARSEVSLKRYQSLCRADRAALPKIKPIHQHASVLANTLARIARARIASLLHARMRVAHTCISARILRAGRGAALTSAVPAYC